MTTRRVDVNEKVKAEFPELSAAQLAEIVAEGQKLARRKRPQVVGSESVKSAGSNADCIKGCADVRDTVLEDAKKHGFPRNAVTTAAAWIGYMMCAEFCNEQFDEP